MTVPKPVLLMTRPRPASERFAASLPSQVRGRLTLCITPLIGIEPCVTAIDTGDARGLIFSSSNAVQVAKRMEVNPNLVAFCVGRVTTQAAERAGWQAKFAGETALDLIDAILRDQPDAPLLHLCGKHVRTDIAGHLTRKGVPTRAQIIYDQPLLPLSDEAVRHLTDGAPIIAPLFSPRTARHFAAIVPQGAQIHAVTLGQAVADALGQVQFAEIRTADRPDADAMAGQIERCLDHLTRVEGRPGAQ